eukprot:1584669-Rhodomonas_salina.2
MSRTALAYFTPISTDLANCPMHALRHVRYGPSVSCYAASTPCAVLTQHRGLAGGFRAHRAPNARRRSRQRKRRRSTGASSDSVLRTCYAMSGTDGDELYMMSGTDGDVLYQAAEPRYGAAGTKCAGRSILRYLPTLRNQIQENTISAQCVPSVFVSRV